jgi:hypothetical protein
MNGVDTAGRMVPLTRAASDDLQPAVCSLLISPHLTLQDYPDVVNKLKGQGFQGEVLHVLLHRLHKLLTTMKPVCM